MGRGIRFKAFIESGPMSDLPAQVRIREVGPRDGFQNEPEVIPTADKVRLIELLGASGPRRIEVTSFVRPDVIPQLADASEVVSCGLACRTRSSVSVLIPNERGLERALPHRDRFHEINGFLSASETHNEKNVGRSVAESLAGLERTFARALAEGLRCEGVISTSFGCPYEGHVPVERVLDDRARRWRMRVRSRSASATRPGWPTRCRCGSSSPRRAERLPGVELTAHFHNTRGQGLANVLAALEAGVESFESSFGELGGCPVPAGRDRATSRPRISSRCCTRWGSRRGSTSGR